MKDEFKDVEKALKKEERLDARTARRINEDLKERDIEEKMGIDKDNVEEKTVKKVFEEIDKERNNL